LLEAAGLPPEGLEGVVAIVARDRAGGVVGGAGLELFGADALLRSVVVDKRLRGAGLGRTLVRAAVELGEERGVRALYLLAESAMGYFGRMGFAVTLRHDVPHAVQQSLQFRVTCPASAVVMTAAIAALSQWATGERMSDRGERAMTEEAIATAATKSCCGPECCGTGEMALETKPLEAHRVVNAVRERYAEIATAGGSCCGATPCGDDPAARTVALGMGYTVDELQRLPDGANLGLGCGAPVAVLGLRPGETVLDLGSGAGLDAFLAAQRVGAGGWVIGVDMTPEMVARARENATRFEIHNVEFREGRLEDLPVETGSVDAVTSNCVVNLVPDKLRVFAQIARVLRPGGRMVISDIVLDRALPPAIARDLTSYIGCVAGAARREQYFAELGAAGFSDVEILRDVDYLEGMKGAVPAEIEALLARTGVTVDQIAGIIRSVTFRARRPERS
jgi:SAM-dependent methyltransferase/N-acetylglutamate synthase-like GNAT family acetyltransferase